MGCNTRHYLWTSVVLFLEDSRCGFLILDNPFKDSPMNNSNGKLQHEKEHLWYFCTVLRLHLVPPWCCISVPSCFLLFSFYPKRRTLWQHSIELTHLIVYRSLANIMAWQAIFNMHPKYLLTYIDRNQCNFLSIPILHARRI